MPSNDRESLGRLTFGQVEGLEPLPRQLARGELTVKLRARLYAVYEPLIKAYIPREPLGRTYFTDEGHSFFNRYFLDVKGEFSDTYMSDPDYVIDYIRAIFSAGGFVELFNFIHFSLNIFANVPPILMQLDDILREEMCAYRIVEHRRLVAIGSQQEAETIAQALAAASKSGALGARAHIRNAVDLLNNGDFSGSIRESISSVESIAKLLSSNSKSKLSDAISELGKKSNIHSSMRAAFLQLYGYTSDEKGIRHALIDSDKPNVDETDALFMIGACSSFVTYLINRAADAEMSVSAEV